ncbi:MAG: MtrB/PioB family outer membrane beta-barrel protein [Burkholderiales bacterium]
MTTRTIPIVVIGLIAASGALAQDIADGFKVSGEVGLGLRITNDKANDAAKLNEYRDLDSGAIGGFDIKGRGAQYYVDVYGENIGRDDKYLDVKGGKYTIFKYQLYQNSIVHNWAFGARTPYAGAGTGTGTLTAVLPNLNTNTWASYDLREKRDDRGLMFELSNNSPWYFRTEANQVTQEGRRLIAGANGTSPGNGFTDKPFPVDYKTRNFSVEGGYASKRGQFSLSLLHSRFNNDNESLRWTNGFFGNGLDTTTLAPDSDYSKIGANGALKQLPFGSTLAGRMTYSKTSNSVPIAASALNTGGVFGATNPDRANFDGDIRHLTASLSLHSNPTRQIDTRAYWNWFNKDNRSPHVTFATPPAGLNCGGLSCITETLSYRKNNVGLDVGYRFSPSHRLVVGFDYVDLHRNRIDFDQTKDRKASIEYRNTMLDWASARLKYQYMQRRSHFLEGDAGTGPADPNYLNRFVARFDASNVDQNLVKVVLDIQPAELWDIGLEGIYKQNRYKDTVLGRTKDDRQELYLSVAWGDIQRFRVMAFADVEWIQYDSYHRNISDLAAANAYDPYAAPNNSNYNWGARNNDRNYAVGLGADWRPAERWKLNGSLIWQRTRGTADFSVQEGALPTVPATSISNYDNTRKVAVNLRGTYSFTKRWDLTTGYAFERFRFSDISYDGYQYTIGAGTGASYLSGAFANPNYTAQIVYVAMSYKF